MKLGAPKELLHRKLALWQQQGVLREEAAGRYVVMETGATRDRLDRGVMLIDSDEERDSNTTTQSEQREEKLQVCSHFLLPPKRRGNFKSQRKSKERASTEIDK